MEHRPVGRAGLTVSAIGLGGGNWGREVDEETSYRVMDYAVENGITFFDTGDLYGGGQSFETRKRVYGTDDQRETTLEMHSSEKIIGRWMASRGCRDEITLCTKVGSGGSAENVEKSLARSLDHFETDHVDIYKLHTYYDDVPVEETLGAMAGQVSAGRARVSGAANHTSGQVEEALAASVRHGWPRFEVLQLPYSLTAPEIEDDLQPYDVYTSDEAFFSTTSPCIMPMTRVDRRPVGNGRPGPITMQLLAAWSEMVGVDIIGQAMRFAKSDAG